MTDGGLQLFGGNWTEQKLDMLRKYLIEWAKVLKNQPFERVYIDAFAGTGYREKPFVKYDTGFFASELAEDEPKAFFDGSTKIALRIQPAFHHYIFIEKSAKQFSELVKLKEEFHELAERMDFNRKDGNSALQDICRQWNSRTMRGVLFLDPFGMQVDWKTLEVVACTKSIDVWILFPLGIGVNRLLSRNGKIPNAWRTRLNRVFGTTDWFDRFYKPRAI
jgi:three-Cys-motif partner protein